MPFQKTLPIKTPAVSTNKTWVEVDAAKLRVTLQDFLFVFFFKVEFCEGGTFCCATTESIFLKFSYPQFQNKMGGHVGEGTDYCQTLHFFFFSFSSFQT